MLPSLLSQHFPGHAEDVVQRIAVPVRSFFSGATCTHVSGGRRFLTAAWHSGVIGV
jgi:hypothetical protein